MELLALSLLLVIFYNGNFNINTRCNNRGKMTHIRPYLIRMFRGKVIESLRLVGGDKLTAPEATLARAPDKSSCAAQNRTIHQRSKLQALHPNAIQETQSKAAFARDECLLCGTLDRT